MSVLPTLEALDILFHYLFGNLCASGNLALSALPAIFGVFTLQFCSATGLEMAYEVSVFLSLYLLPFIGLIYIEELFGVHRWFSLSL